MTDAALLHEVESRGRGAGQPENARAEPVLAAVGVLLDQLAALEGGDEAERRRLVHTELAGEFGDSDFPGAGEDLQDGHGTIDRLNGAPGARPSHPPETVLLMPRR